MTTQSSPPPPGGRSNPLVLGAIAFALVFLLIVGVTTIFVVVRSTGSRQADPTTTAVTDPSATTDPGGSPTEKAAFCWVNDAARRTSTNPAGALRAGPIQFTVPDGFSVQGNLPLPFTDDLDSIGMTIEDSWWASLNISKVVWQPGYEYPGAEKVSQREFDCFVATSAIWGNKVKAKHVEDQKTEKIEVSGKPAYRTSGTVVFDKTTLTTTTATQLVFIVVDTDKGPYMFSGEGAVGVDASLEGLRKAEESLKVA